MKKITSGYKDKRKKVIKINETKAVIMYTVDQQINSSGPWIYLSCFSVANILMCLQVRDVYQLTSTAFSLGAVLTYRTVHNSFFFFMKRELLAIIEVFHEVFLIPKTTILQLLSWMTFLARLTMRLVPLNHEAWEYSFQNFMFSLWI